jgi:hypothetical protein
MFIGIGDSMMYHNTSNTNGNCSGPGNTSPNSTPPNINACSSTTPPLSSGQTNQSDGNGNEMVKNRYSYCFTCMREMTYK